MSTDSVKELRENILKGIELSFEKLLTSKKKEDEDFVFSKALFSYNIPTNCSQESG